MGCTTSHDAFAAAVTSSSSRARARRASASASGGDPAALCRERVALIRAAADSRYALAAAHAAYFRSLVAVGDALRRFAASALAPATPGSSSPVLTLPPSPAKPVATVSASLPPSPSSSSSSTVSPLSHSLSDDDLHLHDLDDTRHGGGVGGSEEASTSTSTRYHRHFMRRSSTVPTVVYEDPDAQTQYTTAGTSYGYAYGDGDGHAYGDGYGYGYSYGSAYPYGPYGEVIAGETPEAAPRQPGPPPSPPTAEASPWEFLDPFAQYDQFMEDYAGGNLPTNSPNCAELRRMEGIPELEDEAELERKAEKSKPLTSGVSDLNIKGKGPIQDNAASNGDFSGDSKLQKNATSKGDSPGGKLQRDATSIIDSSGGKLQRKGSEPQPPPDGKLQRKGSEPAADPEGEGGKPGSRNDSVPSNASSKSKEGGKNTVSLKGTVSSDIDGSSTSGKKKGVAFEAEQSIRPAGGGGESHGKSIQSVVSSEPFSPLHHGTRDVREAIDEVKKLFDDAANCSTDVSRLLEVGKMPPRDTPRVVRCG
jgi:hypothetical protein